jgi:hypothetical protein
MEELQVERTSEETLLTESTRTEVADLNGKMKNETACGI